MSRWLVNFSSRFYKYSTESNCQILFAGGGVEVADIVGGLNAVLTTGQSHKDVFDKYNGFWAVCGYNNGRLIAAVDHIRSFPLFYGAKNNEFFISDCAEWVRERVGDGEMDPSSKREFELAGYVLGSNTLYPNVKQIQAGEYIDVRFDMAGCVTVDKHRYFKLTHRDRLIYDEEELLSELHNVSVRSVERLVKYANGRKVLVPLSGGYDSRLIASLLKLVGYKNVLCFSYGIPGNKEAEYSKCIAEKLGLDWVFVEYSGLAWKKSWESPCAEKYRRMASNHSSLPHVQDWLAIHKLVDEGTVRSDSFVVAPGHCCVTSYIPKTVLQRKLPPDVTLRSIVNTHFTGRPLAHHAVSIKELKFKLYDYGFALDGDKDQVVSEIVGFNWAERQAKYINNSVRVYEHFGLDWWLPLWDREFCDYWTEFPLELRLDRVFYKRFVSYMFSSAASDVVSDLGNAAEYSVAYKMAKAVAEVLPSTVFKRLQAHRRGRKYQNHFLGFDALIDKKDLDYYLSHGYSILGAYSDLYLRGKWGVGGE